MFSFLGAIDFILAKKFNPSNYVYQDLKDLYSIVEPYQLPAGGGKVVDFDRVSDCSNCPRFYYPTCGKDGITYVNPCVLKCINKTMPHRLGQCIVYRRKGSRISEPGVRLRLPTKWRLQNATNSSSIDNKYFDEVLLQDGSSENNGRNRIGSRFQT